MRSAPTSIAAVGGHVGRRRRPRRPSPRRRSASSLNGKRTVLFIDEIHRFNKAQQDALLPHVEDGTITLIGATTENPYFEVNAALLSRMRVWRLEALSDDDVATVVRRALEDEERGLAGELGPDGGVALGRRRVRPPRLPRRRRRPDGDERPRGRRGPRRVGGRPRRGRAASRRGSRTSRRPPSSGSSPTTGPATATTTRSRRSSRASAATTRTARSTGSRAMIAAGEDPRFIARRLIISASEDVGNADPRALQVAVAAAQALDHVGLPEAQYALAQATTYLATAPKSNRSGPAYFAAAGDVEGARLAAGPAPPPATPPTARMKQPRDRRRLSLPARIRGRRRRPAVPARRARRPALLPADRPGLRGDDRGPPGRPRGGPRRGQGAGRTPKDRNPSPVIGKSDPMRTRETSRKKLAETERQDAGA